MRLGWSLVVLFVLASVVAGCGGSGGAATTSEPGTDLPAVTDDPGSEPATPGSGSSAGGSGGSVPDIADGNYMSGTFQGELSGSHPLTIEATLTPGTSITSGGFTSLIYTVGTAPDLSTVQFVIDPEQGGAAISLTSPTILVAGGAPEGCVTTIDRNDASGIAGTFTCPELPGMDVGSNDAVADSITATWSADR